MRNINKYVIIATMLLQSTIIIVFNISILGSHSLDSLRNSVPFFNSVVAITTVLMLISFKKVSYYDKKETELKLIKVNMQNTEQLLNLMHSQKHDYLTHIQSIGALLYLEEYEELAKYLKGISKEYRFTSEIVNLGHPALTALINAKREIAREKGIFFYVKCKQKIDNMEIPSWDLCSLFSNLIENAIEGALMSDGKQWIKLIVDYSDNNIIFEIENTGQIEEKIMNNLFQQGNTSKTSTGRGYGLYISRKIVDKNKGDINIENTNHGTVLSIIQLPGEVGIYDKKVS